MTALMALMMVIMRRHPDRPMTLAVGPVSCFQLVATVWVMGAQLDVPMRDLVLLAGFGLFMQPPRSCWQRGCCGYGPPRPHCSAHWRCRLHRCGVG